MSLYTDPHDKGGSVLDGIETYVAREHWEPILTQAALHGTVLISLVVLLGVGTLPGLATVHILSFGMGMAHAFLALRLEEAGHREAAIAIARRGMASLIVSGTTLLLLPFAG